MKNNSPATALRKLLTLKPGSKDLLKSRENSQIEFKESFNWNNRADYARTLVGYSNNRGGFLVFGVTNEPRRLKGVNVGNFEACDPAKITEFFNSVFSPELHWDIDTVQVNGVTLGFIYSHESIDKPIVCTGSHSGIIVEGAIYYRYRGRTQLIKYAELRGILEERLTRERKAWIQHLNTIGRAGPTNVGIIDTIRGKLFGGGVPSMIDEGLLRKLKFIRSGQFSDSGGQPTLRIIGDVQPVTGVIKEVPVSVGINGDDLISAFVAQRTLDKSEATAYLRQSVYQSSSFYPVNYYAKLSGLSDDGIRELLHAQRTAAPSMRTKILRRLNGEDRITPQGTLVDLKPYLKKLDAASFLAKLNECRQERERRTLLLAALKQNMQLVSENIGGIEFIRLSEAITHLSKAELKERKDDLFESLLKIFDGYATMTSTERSSFRRTTAFCDEVLYGKS